MNMLTCLPLGVQNDPYLLRNIPFRAVNLNPKPFSCSPPLPPPPSLVYPPPTPGIFSPHPLCLIFSLLPLLDLLNGMLKKATSERNQSFCLAVGFGQLQRGG